MILNDLALLVACCTSSVLHSRAGPGEESAGEPEGKSMGVLARPSLAGGGLDAEVMPSASPPAVARRADPGIIKIENLPLPPHWL